MRTVNSHTPLLGVTSEAWLQGHVNKVSLLYFIMCLHTIRAVHCLILSCEPWVICSSHALLADIIPHTTPYCVLDMMACDF